MSNLDSAVEGGAETPDLAGVAKARDESDLAVEEDELQVPGSTADRLVDRPGKAEQLRLAAAREHQQQRGRGSRHFCIHEEAEQLGAVIERVVASGFGGSAYPIFSVWGRS